MVGLILVRMPSVDAFCAAGVCRGWRAAALSLKGLRFSSSITLHCEARQCLRGRLVAAAVLLGIAAGSAD